MFLGLPRCSALARRLRVPGLVAGVLVAALVLSTLAGAPARAAAGGIDVMVDGRLLSETGVLQDGRTLVPMRAIFEALGAAVDYNAATKTITAKTQTKTIKLIIGETTAYVNDFPLALTCPATIIGGRTYVPLRFCAEALGATVNYDAATQTVTVISASAPPPAPPGDSHLTGFQPTITEEDVAAAKEHAAEYFGPDGRNKLFAPYDRELSEYSWPHLGWLTTPWLELVEAVFDATREGRELTQETLDKIISEHSGKISFEFALIEEGLQQCAYQCVLEQGTKVFQPLTNEDPTRELLGEHLWTGAYYADFYACYSRFTFSAEGLDPRGVIRVKVLDPQGKVRVFTWNLATIR